MESQTLARKQVQFGIVPPDQAKTLTGYEFLQKIIAGEFPVPPIGKVMDFRLAEVEPGRAVFTGTPSFDFYNPQGTVHGGYAATLLDSCMGCAIHSTLPAGVSYTTLEFKISFVRPMSEGTGPVRAEGKVISVGKRVGTAEGRIVDSNGKLLAHGTTTGLIFSV